MNFNRFTKTFDNHATEMEKIQRNDSLRKYIENNKQIMYSEWDECEDLGSAAYRLYRTYYFYLYIFYNIHQSSILSII